MARLSSSNSSKAGPAAKAGLQINDVITAVDAQSTAGEKLEQVVSRLRGERGTQVTLKIDRSRKSHTIPITRDLVRLKEAMTPLEIVIREGRYYLDGREVPLSMVNSILDDRAARDKNWPIRLRFNNQSPYPAGQRILEKCKTANLHDVEVMEFHD